MKLKEKWWIAGLVIAISMACALSLFASSEPDGLERVAEDQGFAEKAEGQEAMHSPMPDYAIPGIENEALATSLAGLVGVFIIIGITLGWGTILKRRR